MPTIVVPLEKPKVKESRNECRNMVPDAVTINMGFTESKRNVKSDGSLKSCLKKESAYNFEKDHIPPPYVIWVQFLGAQNFQSGPPPEEPLDYDPFTRNSFVRKVFFLVFIMLVIAAIVSFAINNVPALFNLVDRFKLFISIGATVCHVIIMYIIMCVPAARKAPCSYICLFLTALTLGILCGCFTLWQRSFVIYCAMGATTLVVVVCFLLACSSFDFTKFMLYIVLVATAISGLLLIYVLLKLTVGLNLKPLHIALLVLGVVAQTIVLAMELQMVLGGRTVELGVDEYAVGAFLIFNSIMTIFFKLLQIGGALDD